MGTCCPNLLCYGLASVFSSDLRTRALYKFGG